MRALGIIKARAGSKRLPRKNLRTLNGHPLVAYMCRAAMASSLDRVIVTSEDDEIRQTAIQYGVEAPFKRPQALAGDFARNEDILNHALDWVHADEKKPYDIVVMLQPTTPYVLPETIDACIAGVASGAACCFSARPVREPPEWMFRINAEGHAVSATLPDFDDGGVHTQMLRETFFPTGAAYAISIDAFHAQDRIYARPLKVALMDAARSVDIDDELDFIMAETVGRQFGYEIIPTVRAQS
ncbi:MAG: acylneuraminate cytidylyltransferase family protein [Rhodospirillales bacterium]